MQDQSSIQLFFQKFEPNLIEVSFNDLGGYEKVKKSLKSYARLLDKVSTLKKWNQHITGRILLYGPPGTGKTTLVKALAKEAGLTLYILNVTQILSKYLSETGKNIESAFSKLKEHTGSILFVDEFDSLAKTRESIGDHDEHKRIVNTLLRSLDSISLTEDQLLLIAATNYETILDNAVWRRFDLLIQVGLPEYTARKKILRVLTDSIPTSEKKTLDLSKIAELTEGWSGADLKRLITKAVVDRLVEKNNPIISTQRLEKIINNKIVTATSMRVSYKFEEMRSRALKQEAPDFFDNTFLRGGEEE